MNTKLIKAIEKALKTAQADGLDRAILKSYDGYFSNVVETDEDRSWSDILVVVTAESAKDLVESVPDDYDDFHNPSLYTFWEKAFEIALPLKG